MLNWLMFLAAFLLIFSGLCLREIYLIKRKPKLQKEPGRFYEPMMKINFNPYDEKHYWTKFNPRSRVWAWSIQATDEETEKYSGRIFTELEGMHILSDREKTYSANHEGENHNG